MPPSEMTMPDDAQTVMLILTGISAALAVVVAVTRSVRRRDPVPVYVMLGAAIAICYEPIGDSLGMAYYPENGQVTWIDTLGRKIPAFIGLLFFVYFPPFILWFVEQAKKGITAATWWKVWLTTVLATFLFEPIPLAFDLWTYYGPQPLSSFGFPLYWAFLDATFVYVLAMGVHGIIRFFPRRDYWLIVPAMPMLLLAGHGAPSLPVATTLASTDSRLINELGGLGTIALCVMVAWMGARVYCRPGVPRSAGDAEPHPGHVGHSHA